MTDSEDTIVMYVYLLRCHDGSYYTGVTNDITRRLSEHNFGVDHSCYTFTRRPVSLVFCEEFANPNDAIAAEKQIKGWSRKKKEALIERNWERLKELSRCLNATSHENFGKSVDASSFDFAQDD